MKDRCRDLLVEDLRQRAEQAAWTPWELARHVYEVARTPTLLMAWRLATGLTQTELANSVRKLAADAGCPCSPSTPSCQQISRWENGHDKPGAFYQGLLAAWYRTDPARLGLVGDLTLVVEPDCLSVQPDGENNRRDLLNVAAPVALQLDQIRRRMDTDLRHVLPSAETDEWARIVCQHVAAYGTLPPGTLLERLALDLSDLADLIGRYPQERDLARQASRLCGLVSALHTDLGDARAARNWLYTGGRYAATSDDVASRYWIAMARAMTATYLHDPARVLAIARKAAGELGSHQGAAIAQLTGLAARAHAVLGDSRAARAQLTVAERLAEHLAPSEADEKFFGFPHREMVMYSSQVLTATDEPSAWNIQTDALSGYPASDHMDRPLILLDRARFLARHGEPDQASYVAATAITSLKPAWRVPLLINEARRVGKVITSVSPRSGSRYIQVLREAVPA